MSDGQLGNPFAFSSPDASAPNPAAPMPGMPMPGAQQGAPPAAPPAQSPGFLGQSPDFWRSLAQFGGNLASAANARTSDGHLVNGTGFGGAFGSAIGQTMQDVRQDAIARSNLSNQQQQNYDLRMKNQITAMGMPLLQAKNDMKIAYWKNPNDPRFALPGADAGAPGGIPAASDYATAVNGGEGSGANGKSSASGYGQFTYQPDGSGTWNKFAAANPTIFNGMSPDQVSAARNDQKIGGYATDWLAKQNAPVLASSGVQPSGPSLAISHFLGPQAAAAMMKADPTAAASDVLTGALGPDKTKSYIDANPNLAVQTAGGLRNHYANVPNPSFLGGSQQGPGGQPSSGTGPALSSAMAAQYEQQAALYKAQADKLEQMQKMEVPISGDPALLRNLAAQANEAAIKLRSSAPIASAEAGAKAGVELGTVGPITTAKENAAAAAKPTLDRYGNMVIGDGKGGFIPMGHGSKVEHVWNPNTGQMEWGDVGGIGIGAPQNLGKTYVPAAPFATAGRAPPGYIAPQAPSSPPPNAGPATLPASGAPTPTSPPFAAPAAPSGLAAAPPPMQAAFLADRGKLLADQFNQIDESAAAAKDSNYLFDNMRTDAQTWDMGRFAPFEAEGRAWLSAVAHTFGQTPDLDKPLADYQAFVKSSGQLLRTAVHDTSSRAAVQEFKLIGDSLPQPSTSAQAFGQVADQWQGVNDFRLAKQKFAQGYQGKPEQFNIDFNSSVSPTSFMLNRMSQSPEGQQTMQGMLAQMQKTPEGRMGASRMLYHYNYAKTHGLFDDLLPGVGGGQ